MNAKPSAVAKAPSIKKGDHIYLIDGSGYIFRAFHGLPMMTRPNGTPVNAVYGFSSMMMKFQVCKIKCFL